MDWGGPSRSIRGRRPLRGVLCGALCGGALPDIEPRHFRPPQRPAPFLPSPPRSLLSVARRPFRLQRTCSSAISNFKLNGQSHWPPPAARRPPQLPPRPPYEAMKQARGLKTRFLRPRPPYGDINKGLKTRTLKRPFPRTSFLPPPVRMPAFRQTGTRPHQLASSRCLMERCRADAHTGRQCQWQHGPGPRRAGVASCMAADNRRPWPRAPFSAAHPRRHRPAMRR